MTMDSDNNASKDELQNDGHAALRSSINDQELVIRSSPDQFGRLVISSVTALRLSIRNYTIITLHP